MNYRGYTASPLLGTPEGISVYMDGVRQNQPFGDIVAWDLIPNIAISEMALMPGSNPLFGLNTLGGAISIQTKDGNSQPGGHSAIERWKLRTKGRGVRIWRLECQRIQLVRGRESISRRRVARILSIRSPAGIWKTRLDRGKTSLPQLRLCRQLAHRQRAAGHAVSRAHYSSVYTIPDITWNRSPSLILNVRHS